MSLCDKITNIINHISLPVSFAGSMAVLVTLQLMASLAVANLVHRKDQPPPWLVAPLQGIVGKILCLSDMPLVGEVSETWILCNLLEIRWIPANMNSVGNDFKTRLVTTGSKTFEINLKGSSWKRFLHIVALF